MKGKIEGKKTKKKNSFHTRNRYKRHYTNDFHCYPIFLVDFFLIHRFHPQSFRFFFCVFKIERTIKLWKRYPSWYNHKNNKIYRLIYKIKCCYCSCCCFPILAEFHIIAVCVGGGSVELFMESTLVVQSFYWI